MTEPRFLPELFAMEGLYVEPPVIDVDAWQQHLIREFGPTDAIPSAGGHFGFPEALMDFEDRKGVPAQAIVIAADKELDPAEYETAVQQSWDFAGAADAVARARHTLLASEFMARLLPYPDRLRLFRALGTGLVELTRPVALYSRAAGALYDPQHWLEIQRSGYEYYGLFNVRSFNVEGTADDAVMDTLGLGIFGVPDLQCHFRNLDRDEVASLLYNIGIYLMQNGDVIESGHTIQGLFEGSKWRCNHEESLIAPDREVVDICPDPPHAAGNRG